VVIPAGTAFDGEGDGMAAPVTSQLPGARWAGPQSGLSARAARWVVWPLAGWSLIAGRGGELAELVAERLEGCGVEAEERAGRVVERGRAELHNDGGEQRFGGGGWDAAWFSIVPQRIISWGIEGPAFSQAGRSARSVAHP
jgi:hypothetical protein